MANGEHATLDRIERKVDRVFEKLEEFGKQQATHTAVIQHQDEKLGVTNKRLGKVEQQVAEARTERTFGKGWVAGALAVFGLLSGGVGALLVRMFGKG